MGLYYGPLVSLIRSEVWEPVLVYNVVIMR